MPYIEKLDYDDDLSNEQKKVYNFSLNNNLLIKGAAGSGKTVLALMRAKQLENQGKSVLFIVFNNVLSSFTKMAHSVYDLKKTQVMQIQDMTYNILGYRVFNDKDLSDSEVKTLTSKLQFDHVIIDEGQDFYMNTYKRIFSNLGSIFTVCCDMKQSIYRTDFDEAILPSIFPNIDTKNLEFTYRNPRQIMELTYHFYFQVFKEEAMGTDITCYNQQSGKIIRYSTDDELGMVKTLIKNRGINTVGIFLPRGKEIVPLFQSRLNEKGCKNMETWWNGKNRKAADNPDFFNEKPKLIPYWSAKGIQFDTVILPFLDKSYEDHTKKNLFNNDWPKEWKALFVAMTRARKNLFLIRTSNFLFPYENYLMDEHIEEKGEIHKKRKFRITYKGNSARSKTSNDDNLPF